MKKIIGINSAEWGMGTNTATQLTVVDGTDIYYIIESEGNGFMIGKSHKDVLKALKEESALDFSPEYDEIFEDYKDTMTSEDASLYRILKSVSNETKSYFGLEV